MICRERSCEKQPIFKGMNDWEIIAILLGGMTNDEEMEGVFCNMLENIAEVVSAVIYEDGIGAIGTDDGCKYYLLEWTGLPFYLPKDIIENGDQLKKGKHVCQD
jgi:hypothetical protein